MFKELGEILGNLQIENDKLKAENDELRKNLVDKHTSRCFRLVTHREFDKLIMETVQLRQENKKLKQTLTEIKEIAEMQCVCGVNCQDMKIIRQKISEVLNDR
jgi:regulator of replication initiation timing